MWLRCDTYVKLQNLAKAQGVSVTKLLTRLVEKETAGVELSKRQAKEIKRRIEGCPLLEMAERMAVRAGKEILDVVEKLPKVRMYHK